MHYQTMIFEMLQDIPELYHQLRQNRSLLATLNLYAIELRDRHQAWEESLALARPEISPTQIASQALEIALHEIQARLLAGSPPSEATPLTLDAAMAYIRQATPPA